MNKELEEIIERLNRFSHITILYSNTVAMNVQELKQVQQDIATLVQAVENSIPTSVVEEKIKDIDRALDEEYEKSVAYMQLMCAKNQIKELLGE